MTIVFGSPVTVDIIKADKALQQDERAREKRIMEYDPMVYFEASHLRRRVNALEAENAALRAVLAAARAEAARLCAQVGQMFPFVEAFVENCYAEWDGHEYECPFCGAGHREFNRDDKFLDAVQEHAEGCTWREAAFWLTANAPKPQEPRP